MPKILSHKTLLVGFVDIYGGYLLILSSWWGKG